MENTNIEENIKEVFNNTITSIKSLKESTAIVLISTITLVIIFIAF